ncbi:hypothetical protein IFT73_04500 [Aeromicrobium sp. CFBP 8757]|uniref:DUF6318 family protein n=1 Tax=Aeromicrobium sp. CFBP 8757 TaxID=2775288 RepID=UPI0017802119|nr:DUF6318 family protein [Aeromicrobium sp. CFBP 8757]MBD8606106.1 hypothetical protein [Aeromicrobium sp. CFBP 8757]
MRFGGIVLVTALTLAACSSDPAPREPDPTRSASAAPTPTASLPTMPPQASEDSPEGAAAFVKHYVDVFNYAAATGDVDELRSLAPKCASCMQYADDFERLDAKSRPSQDAWTLADVTVASAHSNRKVSASVAVLNDPKSPYKLSFILNRNPATEVQNVEMSEQ